MAENEASSSSVSFGSTSVAENVVATESPAEVEVEIGAVDFLSKEEESEHYELLLLLGGSTMTDEEAAMVASNVKTVLVDMGASVTHEEMLGRRSLGYTVAKSRTGVYNVFEFDFLKSHLPDLQEKLRLRKDIARFLIIKKRVKTAEELAEDARIQEKIVERRSKRQAVVETEKIAAAEAARAKREAEVASAPTPETAAGEAKPAEIATPRPKKTLEDIDKEIDRILGGDIEL